ncbi:pilus assembly protein PilM [Candidatus Omnitrophota bacterium]
MMSLSARISKFIPQKTKLIGLDLGSSTIKLAEFTHQEGKFTLVRLAMEEIDLQKDAQKSQVGLLKKLFADVDLKATQVNVVINSSLATTRISTIPFIPRAEIPQALKWEMKDSVSFSLDQAAVDYEIIQEVVEAGVKKLKIAAAFVPQETVAQNLDLLAEAGIRPSLFTLSGFALKNIIDHLYPNQTVAVLDIGYSFSELFIFQNKELVFNRKLPVSGQSFTQELTQALVSSIGKTQLSLTEAEQIKRKYGLPDAANSQVLEGKITNAQLLSLLRPNQEKLSVEIERSFDFYREKVQANEVERLVLLGGGSKLNNLAKLLSGDLDLPVELGDPLKQFSQTSPDAHAFAQAVGAAFAAAGAVNLLPVEIKEQTKILVKRSSFKALITAVVVILILLYTGMRIRLGVYGQRITAAQLELRAIAPHKGEVQKKASLALALQECVFWSDALKEIANLIPGQIRLTDIDSDQRELLLKGEIKTSELTEEKVLTQFMSSLEGGIFQQVQLVASKKGAAPDSLYSFELKLGVE